MSAFQEVKNSSNFFAVIEREISLSGLDNRHL
jgi:hypothetical protein